MNLMIDPHLKIQRHLQCAEQVKSPFNTLQTHQVLPLPRNANLLIDLHHVWNVIYNARSNKRQPPTSPNTALATQSYGSRLQWKALQTFTCFRQKKFDSTLIRACNISRSGYLPKFHEKVHLPGKVTVHFHQILRLPRKVIVHLLQQILRPPRKPLMIDPRHIWNVIYNAQSK